MTMSIKLTVPRSNLLAAAAVSAVLATLACIATASAQSQPTTNAKGDMARCQQLFSQRSHYHANGSEPSAQDVQAELALQDCRQGRTEAGIASLEGMLRARGIPLPQPEAAQSR
jgi:hypothetical protein